MRTQWLYGPREAASPARCSTSRGSATASRSCRTRWARPPRPRLAPALWDVLERGEAGVYHAACEEVFLVRPRGRDDRGQRDRGGPRQALLHRGVPAPGRRPACSTAQAHRTSWRAPRALARRPALSRRRLRMTRTILVTGGAGHRSNCAHAARGPATTASSTSTPSPTRATSRTSRRSSRANYTRPRGHHPRRGRGEGLRGRRRRREPRRPLHGRSHVDRSIERPCPS